MYYNISDYTPDMDRLFSDYTSYRLGQGWPAYKKVTVEQMGEIMEETPLTPKYDTLPGKSVDNAPERTSDIPKSDIELMKALYSDVNALINSYVMRIIDNYEYLESPIYSSDGLDRETLAQIVDSVIGLAEEEMDEAEEIALEAQQAELWSRRSLLRSVIEAVVLTEIFAVRRPNYNRVRNNYVYRNGSYDGVRER